MADKTSQSPVTAAPVAAPPKPLQRRASETEFLPAALEIIERPPSPVGRATGATLIALFLTGLVWSVVGHVDIIATAVGKVAPSGKVKVIQPLESGVVRSIAVADGDRVRVGDVLVTLDPVQATADRDRLSRDLLTARLDSARLVALKQAIETGRPPDTYFVAPAGASALDIDRTRAAMVAQAAGQAAKTASLVQQIAQKAAEAETVAATIAKLQDAAPLLQQQTEIREKAMGIQYGNRISYLDAAQRLSEAKHELVVQQKHLGEIAAARQALDQQKTQAQADYQRDILTDLAKAEQLASQHAQDLIKAEQKLALTRLTAPIDGVVQQLAIHTVGGVVTPAQPLLVLVPEDQPLVVEAMVQNRDVGFVHEGQEVEVKVDTFTFTRYGLLHGIVESVSRDAVNEEQRRSGDETGGRGGQRADGTASAQGQGGSVYNARIRLDKTDMMVDGRLQPLGPGMSVIAEIKTGRRRVIDYLLSPLGEYAHDGLRER